MSARQGFPADPARAESFLPGGALGANANVEGRRFAVASASGPYITDTDGNRYLDYVTGAGALILGHQHPAVVEAVVRQAGRTMHQYGALTDVAIELASQLVDAIPCAERIVFATTGSEATAYSMRLARAVTGRDLIVKFEGGFHGNHDYAGIAVATPTTADYPTGKPFTAGTPGPVRDTMLVVPYNDLEALERLVTPVLDRVAGIIAEPVQRIIPPLPGFLEGLRALTERHDLPLAFDEVVTSFRLAYGGAQEFYGVVPDLCTVGKVVGGGFPLAGLAGRAEIMAQFDADAAGEDGFLPQIGTLSGNPIAATAGLATLGVLREDDAYARLFDNGRQLMEGLDNAMRSAGVEAQICGEPCVFDIVFTGQPIVDYWSWESGDKEKNARFNAVLREHGVLKGTSKFYVSVAHTRADIDQTIGAFEAAAADIARH